LLEDCVPAATGVADAPGVAAAKIAGVWVAATDGLGSPPSPSTLWMTGAKAAGTRGELTAPYRDWPEVVVYTVRVVPNAADAAAGGPVAVSTRFPALGASTVMPADPSQ
jgi:hypothetical protein